MSHLPRARYIMIGGFLGAGKTSAVARLAGHLTTQGRRVGLITNDQGSGLVDTAMLRSRGFATEEIPGGCFCCRFDSLVEASGKLSRETAPEVFVAEPVGSCTDLVATVTYPLRRMYGEKFSIAPLSVVVDPIRAGRVLGTAAGGTFSEKINYIYRKQLEEANVIVINKIDLLKRDGIEALEEALRRAFPGRTIFRTSVRTGEGLLPWFDFLTEGEADPGPPMEVDYRIYGEGEALLGWLNATVTLRSESGVDGNGLLEKLAGLLREQLEGAEIAHLKMTLEPREALGDLAVINLVRNEVVAELSQSLEETFREGTIIINLRAEAAPEMLREAVLSSVQHLAPNLSVSVDHVESFRPGQPKPTHRFVS